MWDELRTRMSAAPAFKTTRQGDNYLEFGTAVLPWCSGRLTHNFCSAIIPYRLRSSDRQFRSTNLIAPRLLVFAH